MKLLSLHFRSLILAIIKIVKNPFEHFFNILVISLIIAVLCAVLITSKSSDRWQQNNLNYPQIMIYLKNNTTANDISTIENIINKFNPRLIKGFQFIGKEEGLHELQQDQKLKEITSKTIDAQNNPLPDVLIVNTSSVDTMELNQLYNKIVRLPNVDSVQMDINYANKVSDLISFIKKTATVLQGLFTIILLLVIYNMVRLQMLIRQDEITVSRLIGASDLFIMRPLAYYAGVQIILGSLIAFIFINWFIAYFNSMFMNLNSLFGYAFLLNQFSLIQFIQILVILLIFTTFSVFLAVKWVFKNYNKHYK